ncbi:MAG: response regulator [Acidobacteriia bacterium]|nr:response regulator [Terriglobia bacterium]
MRTHRDRSIRQKLTSIILLTCAVGISVVCIVFVAYDLITFRRGMSRDLTTLAEITGANSTAALTFGDAQSARETLASLSANPHIVEAAILTRDGNIFSEYVRTGSHPDSMPFARGSDGAATVSGHLVVLGPISLNGERIGTIYLNSDLNELYARIGRLVGVVLFEILVAFGAAYLLAVRLQRVISQPIFDLASTASAVSLKKDYSLRATKQSDDEIGSLVDRFNDMLNQIEAREAALQSAHDELERRVDERTRELQAEIADRKQTERELEQRTSFLNSLIENAPLGIVAIGPDHSVRMCNPAFERLFGYRQQDILGQPLYDLLAPGELRSEVDSNIQKVAQGHTACTVTKRRRSDGTFVDVEAFSVPLMTDGRSTGALLLYQDITHRKQAERELEQRTSFLNSLIENAPLGIVAVGPDHAVRMCNPAFERLFGYRQAEILGQPLYDLLAPGELRPEVDSNMQRLWRGQTTHIVTKRRRNDGSLVDVEAFSVPLMEEGLQTGALLLYQDITERKLSEEALLRAKDAAEAASRAKSEFLANMSHEIRTPMNGILGMTELVLDTELDGEQRNYLNLAKVSADSLLSLINDVLDYSKIEAGKLEIDAIDFNLGDSLGDTMKTLSLRAHQKGLELAFEIEPSVPDAVVGDPGRLRQIIVNLVGNGIKFTEQGEVVVYVKTVSRTQDQVKLQFTVADTGIGIPMEKQTSIFEAFNQADGSMTRKYGGTGLGLTISSRLVALMGGRIWVESEPGKGSRFHFTACFALQKTAARTVVPRDPQTLHDMRVLVVDDNATNRHILVKMLENWGMQPTAAESGAKAIVTLGEAKGLGRVFPLILLDAQMPEMDGFALAESIKRNPAWRGATVMMLSSAGQRGDAMRCRELGIAAYLTKPVRKEELLDAILTALGTRTGSETRRTLVTRHSLREGREKLRVLLAEDNAVNQLVALRLLEKHGHVVTVAANGRKALEALEKETYDVVLMDVQMPEMDGLEATRTIREKEKTTGEHIPIVAMTAHAMKGDEERCLEAGMDDYLTKPIETPELLATLEEIGNRKRSADLALDSPSKSSAADAIDLASVLERLEGDRALFDELTRMFEEECPKILEGMRLAIATHDARSLEHHAHTLKGSSANLGALAVSHAAAEIERLAKSDNVDNTSDQFRVLQEEVERLFGTLEVLRQG